MVSFEHLNIRKYRFKKKICIKINRILEQEHFTWIFAKNLVYVVRRLLGAILQYFSEANSRIRYTEDYSNILCKKLLFRLLFNV